MRFLETFRLEEDGSQAQWKPVTINVDRISYAEPWPASEMAKLSWGGEAIETLLIATAQTEKAEYTKLIVSPRYMLVIKMSHEEFRLWARQAGNPMPFTRSDEDD